MDSPHRPSSAESVSLKEEKEKPWKYIGYKVFSRWVASDPSFFVLRRFGTLNARVALSLQDEIAQLEEKLDYMDKKYSDREIPDAHNGTFRDEPFTGDDDRQALVRDVLPGKLAKYNSFLNGYSQLVSRGSCKPDDVASVRRWLRIIRPTAIDIRESEYIDHDDDLVSIHPKTRSPGRNFLENVAFGGRLNPWGIPWLKEWFSRQAPKDIISLKNEETVWPNDQRMEKVSSVLISVVGIAMLIGPIWGLAYIRRMEYRLAVISGFIVVFFVVLAITRSRLYEALAATAAYSAVLVVFLQAGVGRST
ncbi:hypothetical protein K505DRAFT_340422 [Melanomma pulvis-pyrius CBS 109.77]|uniref:DUF6594 domain-containing protein n=1 Tax=Melanomma pulvis-pyrius CBS 109.77 TaxID=1314802 RepID=A0A6A6X1S0_9PLEO|nr:hypothetical protein K505DRAFT_340422 [Melanomma pulvis-pyrius CBS 109.77]